jgi:hypothetical protein
MEQQQVAELMDRWMNDEGFRASIRKDPQGTIKSTGYELSDDQLKAFKEIDWSLSDEELTARASNQDGYCGGCGCC